MRVNVFAVRVSRSGEFSCGSEAIRLISATGGHATLQSEATIVNWAEKQKGSQT